MPEPQTRVVHGDVPPMPKGCAPRQCCSPCAVASHTAHLCASHAEGLCPSSMLLSMCGGVAHRASLRFHCGPRVVYNTAVVDVVRQPYCHSRGVVLPVTNPRDKLDQAFSTFVFSITGGGFLGVGCVPQNGRVLSQIRRQVVISPCISRHVCSSDLSLSTRSSLASIFARSLTI